jgi:ABC-type lipoprotein release transport system permease subunit
MGDVRVDISHLLRRIVAVSLVAWPATPLLASFIPARKAAGIDPLTALRTE